MGQLFIGGDITSESNPPTPDDVDVRALDFCSDDIFFSDDFRNKLDADAFYDVVENLHKTGTLATESAVPTSVNEDEAGCNESYSGPPESRDPTTPHSNHPRNQDSNLSDSKDDPEPPNHAASGKFCQCGVYVWIGNHCTSCTSLFYKERVNFVRPKKNRPMVEQYFSTDSFIRSSCTYYFISSSCT